ncbi:ABC transporter ATP-binding protein [Schleiferilactobacillus perolens]|uniref:Multidrug ABC transporter ATPase n=1 Tax=Schleiferilactobacillus perolens DSM 12744 TaxID=1423792 RepID=A0A0R1MW64_9LACO|nr:ABC transporter ATP-binding protein [Schleiferilactobacillus perolens]KRL12416.1 multidrug ABC transporter ATPase [Schleiferilactobacillus perolens DSM 12744]
MVLAISLKNVRKSFNHRPILKGINLQIQQGSVIGLLGPNGAGKSTLIKIMTGLLKPDSGDVQILGHSLSRDKRTVRKYLGLAPQALAIYPQLSVQQNLKSFGALNGLSAQQIPAKYAEVLTTFGLTSIQDRKAGDLSGGQKRRLHSAIALMNHAKIIFLDEPTVGADVDSRNRIIQAVKALGEQGITIIYTTHYLQEMEALDAQIAFLNDGLIQTTGSVEDIIAHYAHPSLELFFHGKVPTGLTGWRRENDHLTSADTTKTNNYTELLQTALSKPEIKNYQLTDIKITKADLESAYHTLLGGESSNENQTNPVGR